MTCHAVSRSSLLHSGRPLGRELRAASYLLAPTAGSLKDELRALFSVKAFVDITPLLYAVSPGLSSVVRQNRRQVDSFSILPEPLKIIEASCLRREHMHHHAAEVHQHPRTAAMPFAIQKRLACRVHRFFHRIAERFDVRVARRRADQDIICERRNVGNLNQADILAELAVECLCGDS